MYVPIVTFKKPAIEVRADRHPDDGREDDEDGEQGCEG